MGLMLAAAGTLACPMITRRASENWMILCVMNVKGGATGDIPTSQRTNLLVEYVQFPQEGDRSEE